MRQSEAAYWDGVADAVIEGGGIRDNWLKRQLLGQFLLKCNWTSEKVLEIGVGCGASALMLQMACGNTWKYVGTDLSPKFVSMGKEMGLNVVQADVLGLPEGQFTRIIALDSLEHVRPEDRFEGYKNIAARLVKGGLLFINMPYARSLHEDEFDHGIDLSDLVALEQAGLFLQKYDYYEIQYQNYRRGYAFAVMGKH
jgi:SAM-dependent methyltransferase